MSDVIYLTQSQKKPRAAPTRHGSVRKTSIIVCSADGQTLELATTKVSNLRSHYHAGAFGVVDHCCYAGNDGRYPAIVDLILTRFLSNGRQAAVIDPLKVLVPGIVSALTELDRSILPIQGPPGTGKTYVSSCAILELVKRGNVLRLPLIVIRLSTIFCVRCSIAPPKLATLSA
jgi:hypothetical protein